MNNYFFILLFLIPHFDYAGKEADTSNFIQMGVSRLSRQMAPLAPILGALNMNLAQYNYQDNIQPAVHLELNYQQARNGAANMGLKYTF